MKSLHTVAFILLIIGGLNWLAVGLFQMDISNLFPGGMTNMIVRIVYVLVGLAAIYEMLSHKSNCNCCTTAPVQGGM